MILVTLGTHDMKFDRIIKMVGRLINENLIDEKVVIQAGNTEFRINNKNVEFIKFTSSSEMHELYKQANVLITHGGANSIVEGLKNHLKVLVVPRYFEYQEHNCDHQLEITNKFLEKGLIYACFKNDDISMVYKKLKSENKREIGFNNSKMVKIIKKHLSKG